MIPSLLKYTKPAPSATPLYAYEIGENRAPSLEVGLPRIPRRAGRKRRFVRTDFDPTPGGASMRVAA